MEGKTISRHWSTYTEDSTWGEHWVWKTLLSIYKISFHPISLFAFRCQWTKTVHSALSSTLRQGVCSLFSSAFLYIICVTASKWWQSTDTQRACSWSDRDPDNRDWCCALESAVICDTVSSTAICLPRHSGLLQGLLQTQVYHVWICMSEWQRERVRGR